MLENAEKWLTLFVLNCLLVASIISLWVLAWVLYTGYQLMGVLIDLQGRL